MIKILDKHVAEKIAAGEVVERPLSIVKELVENSIDAGADSIVVEIKNGGKSYIRVTDNGCGISSSEVPLAFERHATSKISTDVDLDRIGTLGFRGEALACIAAVAKCEIITKTVYDQIGTQVIIVGSEVVDKTSLGCPDGTTIIVSDLFYNTPARHKFMKTDAAESGLIIDFISKMAIAYPNIKMRLISNGNILFSTQGKGDVLNNILTVYSSEMGKNLVYVSKVDEDMSLFGYVSSQNISSSSKKKQILFVNGRHISSKVMEKGIAAAYSDKLSGGKYPVCFLFFTIQPEKLDVNIHPNKKEVRFDDETQVVMFIEQAINEALTSKESLLEIKESNLFSHEGFVEKSHEQVNIKQVLETNKQETIYGNQSLEFSNENEVDKENNKEVDIKKLLSTIREEENSYDVKVETKIEPNVVENLENTMKFDELQITGAIFSTYILALDDSTLYLIDQHAAHERIFYEQLISEYQNKEKSQQMLMIPFVINVPYAVKEGELSWLDTLLQLGFDIEEFGPKAFRVKAVPVFMSLEKSQEFLGKFIDNVDESTDFNNSVATEKIMANACKFAVKANRTLTREEVTQLLADLSKCQNPYNCPHGRPTLIKLSKYEIEKMFRRK